MTSRAKQNSPRVLVILTAPFNNGGSSRTLDSYFHYWDKACVAQIYTKNCAPTKGHCGAFFQITDESLAKRWVNPAAKVGRSYVDGELSEFDRLVDEYSGAASRLGYRVGATHTPLVELLRGLLWRKRLWCTDELVQWLDDFAPECVLYNFSNHLFTQEVALFVSQRYGIPIIPIVGDDYYFNDSGSRLPFYRLFRRRFEALTERVMERSVNAVYCSEKCKAKYGGHFGLGGEAVYVASQLPRREFRPIDREAPLILYCGSIRLGRNLALAEMADALREMGRGYMLDVYSGETDESVCAPLTEHPNVNFNGAVGYGRVAELVGECDVFVIAEGFRDEDLLFTRYSLSTKAADGLASGAAVLTYGPREAGVVEYMSGTGASAVCDERGGLAGVLERLVDDVSLQCSIYDAAAKATAARHSLESSTRTFRAIVEESVSARGAGDWRC